ncbi:uncharacterized protein LTR77_001602 [Saxophila tyrrhenica]|uniref:PHD-type domain-containing protein n=1 Tax=Saxophila tyrrhenica TaxID=1690608 RepID=A0AAV9PQC4_9PEZI|nr:hypothetical protein LTR77_001602 [Saxophila tyrrhenica]
MVELSRVVGGPVVNSYAVQDKVQEAELDPTMIIEDELFAAEAWEPCSVCGAADETHELMYCDRCDKATHVFCAGFDESPEIWYCEECHTNMDNGDATTRVTPGARRRTRGRMPTGRRQTRGRNDPTWARVWQEVSRRLDFDLDFPFDDDTGDQRTEEQRREFSRWERRFQVASQQGAANRLRNIANAQIQQAEPAYRPAPESQEELRAWNAFDKARESQDAPTHVRRRKRKRTASPSSSGHEVTTNEAPQQKRPRLRRPRVVAPEPEQNGESSADVAQRPGDGPTFLSSLLREVESKPVSASSPGASDQQNGQYSPRDSPPAPSASSSDCGTPPRRLSATPPPPATRRLPVSPPLSSTIVPLSSPMGATFSPFSPTQTSAKEQRRGRRHQDSPHASDDEAPQDRASSASPSRNLSYSAKEEIQRMVKLSLRPRYNNTEITKDQYTDINRDVSRKLYELVGSAAALSDQAEREKWQGVADDEVKKAVDAANGTAEDE